VLRGGCLCGAVRFEVDRVTGPFELCHCSRCRRSSGSAFVAGLGARIEDFRIVSGAELIRRYEAPILRRPPAYTVAFCSRCGSHVPGPEGDAGFFEIPAGTLDEDPGLRPDKHIFVDCGSDWFEIADDLPRFTRTDIYEHRLQARAREDDGERA